MAVIHDDHLSHEVGHTTGVSRVLLTVGMVLVGVGVLVFLAGVVLGIYDASKGTAGDGSVRLFPIGGAAVVLGSVVAATGMALGRKAAGE